ncbi:MAG: acyltransferase family protein [Steroidobacteraceae bacterium]
MSAAATTTARPRAPRVDWVDYSKGICIFFVVMLHCNGITEKLAHASGWLSHVVEFARPFRMPDFFLIAGLFLASVINRPWRTYLDKKVVHFYYFYAIWASIQFLSYTLWRDLGEGADAGRLIRHYIGLYLDPEDAMWFIFILPIFFVVTRWVKSLPWWTVWAAAALLQSLRIETDWVIPNEFAARYLYFYSGYAFAPLVFRMAEWALAHAGRSLGYLAAWGLLNGWMVSRGWSKLPGVSIALGYLGGMAVVFTAGLCTRVRWTRPLRYLGEHSIVVYLANPLVARIMLLLAAPLVANVGTLALGVTVLTVAGTVALYWLCSATPLWFLYRRPAWVGLPNAGPIKPVLPAIIRGAPEPPGGSGSA